MNHNDNNQSPKWAWTADGVDIQLGVESRQFKFSPARREDLSAAAEILIESQEVYEILATALAAFHTGEAQYADAFERVRVLRIETYKAAAFRRQASEKIFAFLDPPNAGEMFDAQDSARMRFAGEVIGRIAVRPEAAAAVESPAGT